MDYTSLINKAIESGNNEIVSTLIAAQVEIDLARANALLSSALIAARLEFPPIIKTKTAGGRYKYADLQKIQQSIDPILSKHGLSYNWDSATTPEGVRVRCILRHKDGGSHISELTEPPDTSGNKSSIQALGSAETYLQRYTLMTALGLSAGDDTDGAANVTAAEVKQLEQAFLAHGVDKNAWMKRHEITSLADIPKQHFQRAMGSIRQAATGGKK